MEKLTSGLLKGGAPVPPVVELFRDETLGERVTEETTRGEHVANPRDVTGIYQGSGEDLADGVQ